MVRFSPGNIKMGSIPSVSLPAGDTCRPDAPCYGKCYGRRLESFRKTVHNSYVKNLSVLRSDPDTYWREVEATIMMSRYFRFHVSGDIPDEEYFRRMIGVAERQPHCQILCFTKRDEFVNNVLNERGSKGIPDNLHLIFSVWRGLSLQNPYKIPEAHIIYKDGTTTAREDAVPCGGNCTTCAKTNGGCWALKRGEQLTIHEH